MEENFIQRIDINKMGNYRKRINYQVGMRFFNYILTKSTKSILSKGNKYYTAWEALCDCGIEFVVRTKEIGKGRKSCGCLSRINQFRSIPYQDVILNGRYCHYKNSAKSRNYEFNLTHEEFNVLMVGNCHYCGSEPLTLTKRQMRDEQSMLLNGIDRFDNAIGYITTNSVTCCRFCNFAKSNFTHDEFQSWISRLVNFKTKS